jgi:hypothetical protein
MGKCHDVGALAVSYPALCTPWLFVQLRYWESVIKYLIQRPVTWLTHVLISNKFYVFEISDELHAFKKYLPVISLLETCEVFITSWSWYPYKWFNKGQYRGMDVVESWLYWEIAAHLHGRSERSERVTHGDENWWG